MFPGGTALVTGASQGIGETIALGLAKEGLTVFLVDVQREKLEAVAARIAGDGGRAIVQVADVSRFDQAAEIVAGIVKEHQRLDYLVNNAGITRDNLLMRMREEEWDAVLAVNLKGVFNFCRAAVRRWSARASAGSSISLRSWGHGERRAGQLLRLQGGSYRTDQVPGQGGSRPEYHGQLRGAGYIKTAMTEALSEAVKKAFLDMIPMKRMGTAEDVAQAVKFLLSEQAAYITGQVIHVNVECTPNGKRLIEEVRMEKEELLKKVRAIVATS